ncbi:MAG TPA: hypothetical protein VM283_07035, partial [Armatimonadota bacterium]|nr:hypothetical protein [Armatimonadota bacterium]
LGDDTITRCVDGGMWVLGMFFATPTWASGAPAGLPASARTNSYPPRDLDQYAEYVRRTVEHYRDRIRYWEVWNEPDASNFWRGTPEEYVELEKLTYRVAKQADPTCVVIGGGGLHYSMRPWIERAAAAGMLDHCDWLSYHAYVPADEPPETTLRNAEYFRDLLARYGRPEMPLVCTEGGVLDTTFYDGLDLLELPPQRVRPPMSWHRGACRLVQVAALEMAAGVRKRFYYYEKCPPPARAYLDTSALEITGAPRPKLMAWVAMERQLRGSSFAGQAVGEGWRACVFGRPEGSVAVLWAGDDLRVSLRPELPEGCGLVDLMGNPMPAPDRGLELTEEPVYLTCPRSADELLGALHD